MTLPTPERVRELLDGLRMVSQYFSADALYSDYEKHGQSVDQAIEFLADWLRLGEKPAPSRAYTGCGGTFIKRDENGNRKLIGEPCEGCPDCSPTPSAQAKCGYQSYRNHTCALPAGHDGEHNSRADMSGSTWGTDPDDAPPSAQAKCEDVVELIRAYGNASWCEGRGETNSAGSADDLEARLIGLLPAAPPSAQAREALEAGAISLLHQMHDTRRVIEESDFEDSSELEAIAATYERHATLLRSMSVGGVEVASQWRDIATAPRDGSDVMVCYKQCDSWFVHNAFWLDGDEDDPDESGWWSYLLTEVTRTRLNGCLEPTHWRPCLAAPVSV